MGGRNQRDRMSKSGFATPAPDDRVGFGDRGSQLVFAVNLLLARKFHCRACGGRNGYRSRSRNENERLFLRLVLLRAVRCEVCRARFYAPFFMRMKAG